MSSNQLGERFHHTGFVVASIAGVMESFRRAVGGSNWSETWHDPLQRVRVAFIYPSHPGDPSVELAGPGSPPVEKFLGARRRSASPLLLSKPLSHDQAASRN